MRKLLGTLYVVSQDALLSLKNDNVVIQRDGKEVDRYSLLSLESIVSFSRKGATVPLMIACAERGIQLSFLSIYGKYLCRICGAEHGNVLLRREQYRRADEPEYARKIATEIVLAKIHNCKTVLFRAYREAKESKSAETLSNAIQQIHRHTEQLSAVGSLDVLRGLEGTCASRYFGAFDAMILQQKTEFSFHGRSAHPPLDSVNSLLSFGYTLLANDCTAALESVGLDACVGFLHQDHVGRNSLALDLMEELRAPMVDRLVLSMINRKQIRQEHFAENANGEKVWMNDAGRKIFLQEWQKRKQDEIFHPLLEEKVPWGLVPYAQAQHLARIIRGEQEGKYRPYYWR